MHLTVGEHCPVLLLGPQRFVCLLHAGLCAPNGAEGLLLTCEQHSGALADVWVQCRVRPTRPAGRTVVTFGHTTLFHSLLPSPPGLLVPPPRSRRLRHVDHLHTSAISLAALDPCALAF